MHFLENELKPLKIHSTLAFLLCGPLLHLAVAAIPADQRLDAVSLVPVLTGRRDDAQPVRRHLLVQSSPGRDASHDGGIKGGPLTGQAVKRDPAALFAREPDAGGKTEKRPLKKSGATTSDGMAHAFYDGDWKLVLDSRDQPAALYDLPHDLIEQHNLLAAREQTARVQAMTQAYREIRASPRSTQASDR